MGKRRMKQLTNGPISSMSIKVFSMPTSVRSGRRLRVGVNGKGRGIAPRVCRIQLITR